MSGNAAHENRFCLTLGKKSGLIKGLNHESIKKILARIIETCTMVLNIRMVALGSTTFKREDLARGLEPDECYYFANAPAVERKRLIDLSVDPAPDLVVEVDISPYQLDRSSIYAALGIPEMWLYDGKRVIYAIRNEKGEYISKDKSLSLPGLSLTDVNRFVKLSLDTTHHDAVMAIFDWAQKLPANPS
jgi:Uma2 family endonuclease